jgi:single-strand DNA-binding protein
MLKATLIGNLGSDPELRYSANGSAFLRMNVAANTRTQTSQGAWEDRIEWVRVTVTGTRAETLPEYLRKGSRVYVEGRLEARPWMTRESKLRAGLELVAFDVEFMSARGPTLDMDDDAPVPSVVDERPRRIPEAVAVNGGRRGGQRRSPWRSSGRRGGPVVADEDDVQDLPF